MDVKHNKNKATLSPEVDEQISGFHVPWDKTKEEIWPGMLDKIEGQSLESIKVIRLRTRVLQYAAAVVAVLIGFSATAYFYTVKIIPSNQQMSVVLPDSSQVLVYPQSQLLYKPLLWKLNRKVSFEGEGVFKVKKGEKFEVVSNVGTTMVLGTRFRVFTRENKYIVSCMSGKVKVVEPVYSNSAIITGGQVAVLKEDHEFYIDQLQDRTNHLESHELNLEEEIVEINPVAPPHIDHSFTPDIVIPEEEIIPDQREEEAVIRHMVEESLLEKPERMFDADVDKTRSRTMPGSSPVQTSKNIKQSNDKPEVVQANRGGQRNNAFNSSLSSEQVSILENQQLSREERREAFLESLSPQQLQLFNEMKEQHTQRPQQHRSRDANTEPDSEQSNPAGGNQEPETLDGLDERPGRRPPRLDQPPPTHNDHPDQPPPWHDGEHHRPPPPGSTPPEGAEFDYNNGKPPPGDQPPPPSHHNDGAEPGNKPPHGDQPPGGGEKPPPGGPNGRH